MELKDIKNLNQKIYEMDTEITRNAKMMFVATLMFCSLNNSFWDVSKLTSLVNFNTSKSPVDDLIKIAKIEIEKLPIMNKTKQAVYTSLTIVSGVNTKLNSDPVKLQNFVKDFIVDYLPLLKDENILFLETLYMEVDKKAKGSNEGITLTPSFAAQLMVELAELDYKKDVIADLASGTGLFSLLSYSIMLNNLEDDKKTGKINDTDYKIYSNRLFNSIIANDFDAKMVTLCLANFVIKKLNPSLLYYEDVFDIQKSTFNVTDSNGERINIRPTKGILNPPYEDKYKPVEVILQTIKLIKENTSMGDKVVAIIPPQKFGQKRKVFQDILNYSTLKTVIKMQDDLFTDSGQTPSTSIFVFSLDREHQTADVIKYFDFTDSGYIYLKDSGMVDKNNTHEILKKDLMSRINGESNILDDNDFVRRWDNFYEVNKEIETKTRINPMIIGASREEADITLENITIKKMLSEKNELIEKVNNLYEDKDKKLEKYIVDILSEDE